MQVLKGFLLCSLSLTELIDEVLLNILELLHFLFLLVDPMLSVLLSFQVLLRYLLLNLSLVKIFICLELSLMLLYRLNLQLLALHCV